MKRVFGLISLVSMSLLFACTKPANDHPSDSGEWKEITLTIDLNECENITFGNDELTLCLDSVADSRCPINANCIWSGTAITRFSFTKNDQSFPVVLATPPFASYQQQVSIAGYTIKLINVLPYPELGPSAPANQIKAKIEIKNY
jgi:hypothetical protein